MKKILCPTDFSDAAQNAIAYAAKLARATGGTLTLLNVQSPLNSPYKILHPEKELIHSVVLERLEEVSKEVHQFFKISCDTEVFQSPSLLSTAIAEKATGFDLIVMGTHGAQDLFEFFRGSNTYHAIRKSKVPVMLVPSSCTYSEINTMVYSYNYLRELKLPLIQLKPWIKALKCELTILQVNEEAVSQDIMEEMDELKIILRGQWEEEEIKLNFDSIRSAEVAPSINSYIQRNQNDVLALCTVHRNFIEGLFHKSVIKIISEIANYPVFVFHE
jgi:nucleotide-binding universal stress UspA family protein